MHPQAFVLAGHAAQHAIGLVGATMQRHHDYKLTKIKTTVLEMMTGKVTTFQLVTTRDLGQFVLNIMAKEHRLFREEYARDRSVHRATTDVVLRAELNASSDKAMTQMTRIRESAMTFHNALAVLLGRAAEQIMDLTGDIALPMPGEFGEPGRLPVLDDRPFPANDVDEAAALR